jgi:hypothetical protein
MDIEIDDSLKQTLLEEGAVREILRNKITGLHSYNTQNADLLAYRLAEILVLSKDLYTKLFPELINADSSNEQSMWDLIMGVRMHLLHMRDCIDEFDGNLLDLMEDKEEEDDDEDEDF